MPDIVSKLIIVKINTKTKGLPRAVVSGEA